MNNNRNTLSIAIILSMIAAFALGAAFRTQFDETMGKTHRGENAIFKDKIEQIVHLIENNYVDEVVFDSLTNNIINTFLYSLDPHSHYLSASEFKAQSEDMQGYFDGIGITLNIHKDTICIMGFMPDSPAKAAGLQVGDRIVSVDSSNTVGLSTTEIIKLIRGPKNTPVDLGVVRYGETDTLHFFPVRDAIATPSLPYYGMIDDRIGYIRIDRFVNTTHLEFVIAMNKLLLQEMDHLILDLRGNGGGLLDAAINIADEFLPKGNTIVYTEGAHSKRTIQKASQGGLYESGDLSVLIDENSASASEVIAGALQDNDRALILGRRSFGKGLVQQQFPLPGNSAILLTTSRYYTPSGRCIQRSYDYGVTEYYGDYIDQILNEALSDSAMVHITDSTPYYTTNGRTVYGGGGIYPDIPLPYIKDSLLIYFNKLSNNNIINDYAFSFITRNGQYITEEYPTDNDFVNHFVVTDKMIEEIYLEGEKNNIKRDEASIRKYDALTRNTLKTRIADALYGTFTFYRIYLEYDDDLQRTLKIINQ